MSELGRSTTCNVSGYVRDAVHQCRLLMNEKRTLTANFNGAMDAARKITSATWRCEYGYVAAMANAAIATDGRSTSVQLTAAWMGTSMIQCEATLDNGDTYTQLFEVDVSGNPWFLSDTGQAGPVELVVTA